MKRAYAVIGAHYGDEGKGQVTAWICRRIKAGNPEARILNVLTNGGCQRGHTVNITNSKHFRHVFKHFGCGTPYGAHTMFGPEFILNPMQFIKELDQLRHLKPVVYCGWHNRIQLPVDMAVNQYLERERAGRGEEHGSVGFGVNETLLRYERGMGRSFLKMASDADSNEISFVDDITALSHEYAHDRIIEEMGEESAFMAFESKYFDFISKNCYRHFTDDLLRMYLRVNASSCASRAYDHDFFVFENGQGIKIGQQESKSYFNCTPSDTGAFSVLRTMSDMRLIGDMANDKSRVDGLDVYYVTRTYMTRHGAGPFSSKETEVPPFHERDDQTNVPNEFQGRIRYAEFSGPEDFDAMKEDMRKFDVSLNGQCELRSHVAVTHYGYYSKDAVKSIPVEPSAVFPSDQPDSIDMRDDLQF